jgi:hypothetical protein
VVQFRGSRASSAVGLTVQWRACVLPHAAQAADARSEGGDTPRRGGSGGGGSGSGARRKPGSPSRGLSGGGGGELGAAVARAADDALHRARVFAARHNLNSSAGAARVLLVAVVLIILLTAVVPPMVGANGAANPRYQPPLHTVGRQPFFNAHHSPIGAFASFTLGFKGAAGGLGLEEGKPPNQNVYVMLEQRGGTTFDALPFFPLAPGGDDGSGGDAFFSQMGNTLGERHAYRVLPFDDADVARVFRAGSDTWQAGDLTFSIYSPVREVPDPTAASANEHELEQALVPAVIMELVVDNTGSDRPRRVVFGYAGSEASGGTRRMDELPAGMTGVAHGLSTGIATDSEGMQAAQGFALGDVLGDPCLPNRTFALGTQGVLVATAAARKRSVYRFAAAFYRGGRATSGQDAVYYYTRFFDSLESVASYALSHFSELKAAALEADALLERSALSEDQRFSLAHALRAYFGSTQLLAVAGKPLWVVNEGEYRMMNTFDLTVDQLFLELRLNPWTVRNVLDAFTHRYSYTDTVAFPPGEGGAAGDGPHPGGLSFTHDMGVANAFAPPGQGAYEQAGLRGLFSFMTHEQLINWVLCATAYVHATGDGPWLAANIDTLSRALASMQARDHPDPAKRDGIMSLDSTRTAGGAEITTYDSLDASLGRARGNVYLGGKTWAAYVALEHVLFSQGRETEAAAARAGADAAARTLTAAFTSAGPGGHMPAVLGAGGSDSAIISAIEGLAFPPHCGVPGAVEPGGRYKEYLGAMKGHLEAVLRPGVCLFRDGGWKLSSSSDNSWLSKVYLAQHVARTRLGLRGDDAAGRAADAAHAAWLLHPEQSYWGWSDQMVAGVASASRYYPRGVTAILWLDEVDAAAAQKGGGGSGGEM